MIPGVRKATLSDIISITEIYNEAVLQTDATFDSEPSTVEQQKKWFREHGVRNPIIVAEIDGKIIGWASLSEWSTRCAYTDTAEISLYITKSFQNHGIGKKLMQTILSEGKKAGLHTVISRITGGNDISIHLHEQFGFKHIGIMKEVGKKFGRLLDVYMMQKIY